MYFVRRQAINHWRHGAARASGCCHAFSTANRQGRAPQSPGRTGAPSWLAIVRGGGHPWCGLGPSGEGEVRAGHGWHGGTIHEGLVTRQSGAPWALCALRFHSSRLSCPAAGGIHIKLGLPARCVAAWAHAARSHRVAATLAERHPSHRVARCIGSEASRVGPFHLLRPLLLPPPPFLWWSRW